MKWKSIIFLFLIILIPLIMAENNITETISNSTINQSINKSRDGAEDNTTLEIPELSSVTPPEQNQSENLTETNISIPENNFTINNTDDNNNITIPTNDTNLLTPINNTPQNITEIEEINNTITETNQTNQSTLIQIFNIIINYIAEGATYFLNLFTLSAQGTLTSGAIYEARFLLTGIQIGNPNAVGSTYEANIGFFELPEQVTTPILISTFISPSNGKTITQGDTSVTFVVKLENTGGENATNITLFIQIPSEWTIVSGGGNNTNGTVILDSEFNLTVGQNLQKVLEVSIPDDATTGDFTLIVNSTGYNETGIIVPDNRLVGDSVTVTVTTQYPAPTPTPTPPTGGGGTLGTTCTPNWTCNNWTTCIQGTQTRICTDINDCATPLGKPLELKDCSIGDALFDLKINITERELEQGEPVQANIELLNFGTTGAFNILLKYEIINPNGNIIYTEDETLTINIQKQFTKTFEIPDSEGEHILRATLTHADQEQPAIAEDKFVVIVPKRVFAPFAIFEAERIRGFFSGFRLFIILAIMTLFIIFFVLRRHYTYMKDKISLIKGKRRINKKVKVFEKEHKIGNRVGVLRKKKKSIKK